MYYVYIIYSSTGDCYYKGITANLDKRINEHNHGKSRYTKNKIPLTLIYSNQFESKQQALIEEKRIKKLNRNSLLKVINED